MTPDPLTAALDQLAACRDHATRLDAREADHFAKLSGQLTQLAATITTLGHALADDTTALARLEALDRQVTALAARLPATSPDDGPASPGTGNAAPGGPRPGGDGYQPGPPPPWWKLDGPARREPAARLRAWVEQVYRPGYGHLAATLGTCWEAHDLCLYALDIASQLWSALYLQPERGTGLLSAQAEYQARILPALAGQLMAETTGCGHDPSPRPAVYPRSAP